ncbi:hypothetical protein MAPG_08773 [Magnaporthiopsis poae ATCC 64411]|uniref:Uncharacterized protein n=1 Tax=Magnaporthiopsis poae (strain ATCC 64411 / 73-15) TaxID=644358 RepID=A0A0C4E879_MAGP6|nr:hypothetical protein MAPG_08773 [Magnaporthiopsis poae ATCC 64411]
MSTLILDYLRTPTNKKQPAQPSGLPQAQPPTPRQGRHFQIRAAPRETTSASHRTPLSVVSSVSALFVCKPIGSGLCSTQQIRTYLPPGSPSPASHYIPRPHLTL